MSVSKCHAILYGSFAGTRKPLLPSSINEETPPTFVATTGQPIHLCLTYGIRRVVYIGGLRKSRGIAQCVANGFFRTHTTELNINIIPFNASLTFKEKEQKICFHTQSKRNPLANNISIRMQFSIPSQAPCTSLPTWWKR